MSHFKYLFEWMIDNTSHWWMTASSSLLIFYLGRNSLGAIGSILCAFNLMDKSTNNDSMDIFKLNSLLFQSFKIMRIFLKNEKRLLISIKKQVDISAEFQRRIMATDLKCWKKILNIWYNKHVTKMSEERFSEKSNFMRS